MSDILHDLRKADKQGISPPQNWTTRAANEIERLRKEVGKQLYCSCGEGLDSMGYCPICDTKP